MEQTATITVSATVNAPIEKVWTAWNTPEHVVQWNTASPDWHTPKAENDLRTGGTFSYRMEAKDGSFGFDFGGIYDAVEELSLIKFTMGDGRRVETQFRTEGDTVHITQTFEPESTNPVEMQRQGWQSIMDSFKRYVEKEN